MQLHYFHVLVSEMADYKLLFQSKENQNWAKCSYAIQVTRLGLLEFCKNEIVKFHSRITSTFPQGTRCSSCKRENVIPYSKPGHQCRKGRCRCFSTPCVKGVCDKLKNLVETEHRRKQISWKNTNISDWVQNPWEIAKCYFPETGYIDKKTAESTDFNGIISLIMNNRIFERMSSLPNLETVCDRVSARIILKENLHEQIFIVLLI